MQFENSEKQDGRIHTTTDIQVEWIRVNDATRIFAIGRSKLYDLINAGVIRSTCIRARGKVRGKRLLFIDSIRQYLEASATGGTTSTIESTSQGQNAGGEQ